TPANRGLQKVCSRLYDRVIIELPHAVEPAERLIEISMPIGHYMDCQVAPTCGLASETGIIGLLDDPASFYEPAHVNAQLIWFRKGYVEYRFPNRLPPRATLDSLQLSMEICSEAPLHHDDWPSDITVWINGIEIGTWTSPADFGGQRGSLTPDWWETWNSQFGLLKVWQVTREHTYIDGIKISDVSLADLQVEQHQFITVRIGVKEDAKHVGGLNLFGAKFGNYPQDILLRLAYTD
ncbi:MAG: transcriptional regulator, partial [Anaerolineales bacterium]